MDFTNGKNGVKMMYTKKDGPKFESMTAVTVDNDNVGVDGKKLFRTALGGNFNVAFVQGENFYNAGTVSEGTTYIYNNGEHWSDEEFVNIPSGLTNVAVDEAAPEYYNLQGVRVDNPGTGVYIVRRGTNTYKTIIR